MVDNSTNINKRINYLLSQAIEHKKRPLYIALDIQFVVWDRYNNLAKLRLKLVNGIPFCRIITEL